MSLQTKVKFKKKKILKCFLQREEKNGPLLPLDVWFFLHYVLLVKESIGMIFYISSIMVLRFRQVIQTLNKDIKTQILFVQL